MTTTFLLIVFSLLFAAVMVPVTIVAVLGATKSRDAANNAMRTLAERHGWAFVPGSITAEEMYRIDGPGFHVRARNTRQPGPARYTGLNTVFYADLDLDGSLWIGGRDQVDGIPDLAGEPLDLVPLTTGDAAFDERFQILGKGIDVSMLGPETRKALLCFPLTRNPQVLLHPPGVSVVLHGMVTNQADVDRLIDAGRSLLPS